MPFVYSYTWSLSSLRHQFSDFQFPKYKRREQVSTPRLISIGKTDTFLALMALVFPPSSPSVLTRSSSSPPSTIFSPHLSTRIPDNTKQFGQQRVGQRWNSPLSKPGSSVAVSAVGLAEPPVLDPPGADLAGLKLKLLGAVSGLNRGLAADKEDLERAESAAKELESAGGIVDLTCDLDKLQGRWKLVYSSAFSSRTLGGSRPGPPTGRLLPITLGKVFQRIDVLSNDFDNIVELELGTPWPLPKAEATATLAHKFELTGSAKIKITFVNTTVKPTGSLSQIPPIDLPRLPDGLRPPSSGRGEGEFEVTYLDSDTRITRGDKGELRVFLIA